MKRTALVTGASSGIGMEIARLHAAQGGDLVLVARTTSKLNALRDELVEAHDIEVLTMPKDLSIPDAALELYEAVIHEGIEVQYLFNAAGFAEFGKFHDADWDRTEMMMNVNMLALTQLTYLFGGDMLSEGHGGVLNVSAAGNMAPHDQLAVYNATKHYVQAFTDSLAQAWQEQGVTIRACCPRPTATNFFSSLNGPPTPDDLEDVRVVAEEAYRSLIDPDTVPSSVGTGVFSKAISWLPKGIRKGLAGED